MIIIAAKLALAKRVLAMAVEAGLKDEGITLAALDFREVDERVVLVLEKTGGGPAPKGEREIRKAVAQSGAETLVIHLATDETLSPATARLVQLFGA